MLNFAPGYDRLCYTACATRFSPKGVGYSHQNVSLLVTCSLVAERWPVDWLDNKRPPPDDRINKKDSLDSLESPNFEFENSTVDAGLP